jgi:hypothetical protein
MLMETTTGLESQDARQAVLHLLERAQRRLARAVQAAGTGDRARLLDELVVLACLVHISSRLVAEGATAERHDAVADGR